MTDNATPTSFDDLFPGRFLKAGLLKGLTTLTISGVILEELIGDKGPQIKGIVSFSEETKQLVLNKTNGICLREMFGRQVQEWRGKRVTLFASQWNGEPCIRVWGSPDIDRDTEIIVQLPRKKPITMTMHFTGKKTVSEAVSKYLSQMKSSDNAEMLVDVQDAIVEDNALTIDETALLAKAMDKRRSQLGATQ